MNRITMVALMALMTLPAAAQQSAGGRDAFLKQQALAEVQRMAEQIDVLQNNQDELSGRIRSVEAMQTQINDLKAEIAALRSELSAVRRDAESQRGKLVDEMTKKIVAMQPKEKPSRSAPAREKPVVYDGPCYEYTVAPGDTLSLIAKAFNTSVQKIKDINGMKKDMINVGQVIKVPKE